MGQKRWGALGGVGHGEGVWGEWGEGRGAPVILGGQVRGRRGGSESWEEGWE